jgi:hypothetical protein
VRDNPTHRSRRAPRNESGRHLLKRFRTAAVLAGFVLLALPSPGSAATPCWKQLINDWYDGRIDQVYPLKCYQQALENAPEDAKVYSDLPRDLNRALQAAIRGQDDGPSNGQGSRQVPAGAQGRDLPITPQATPPPDSGREKPEGFFAQALDLIGPNNADSIPLPLYFLAGLALLLMTAGAAGVVTRRVQARRPAAPRPPEPPSAS